jgi:hypothetical protein
VSFSAGEMEFSGAAEVTLAVANMRPAAMIVRRIKFSPKYAPSPRREPGREGRSLSTS